MVPSTGLSKIKTAIFISRRGSNLKSLIEFSKTKKSPISICLIVTNNSRAKGLIFANIYKIKKKIINFEDQKLAEKKILLELKKNEVQLICLAGFMTILSKNFIKNFKGNILNIHPSLLPKYKGLNTHQRVLNNNEIYSGCTVHYVTSKLDSGKIIIQKRIKVSKKDTVKTLEKKILNQEHKLYPKALLKIFSL